MKLREFLRARRQRKARKRYEREKALREGQQDPNARDRAAGILTGGDGFDGGIPN